jgi:hypothetical protein
MSIAGGVVLPAAGAGMAVTATAVGVHVDVDHARRLAEDVMVDGRLLDAAALQRADDRIHFGFGQHHVAGDDGTVRHFLERDPSAEREGWTDLHVAYHDAQIGPWKVESINVPGLHGARAPDRRFHSLPVDCGHRGDFSAGKPSWPGTAKQNDGYQRRETHDRSSSRIHGFI